MIPRLRIKFICVVMTIVTLMLAAILGTVVYFTNSIMRIQSYSVMSTVAANPVHQKNLGKPSRNFRLSLFTVETGRYGELIDINGGYGGPSDEAYLSEITDAALASEQESGELKQYKLRYLKIKKTHGLYYRFLRHHR